MTDTISLSLRPLTIDDIDDRYASWYANNDGHLDYYTTSGRSFSKEWLIEEFQNAEKDNKHFYAIIDDTLNIIIGTARIGPVNIKHMTSDIVTFIGDRNYLGKGMAKDIIKQTNMIAFNNLDIRKLAGNIYCDNFAALKAYIHSGWMIEGILRSHIILNNKPVDLAPVACFNPRYFDKDFMDKAQKNHDSWFNEIFERK
jgi:RimJ/RimL family protein N-acetyltransferase